MLTVLREQIAQQLDRLPDLIDRYGRSEITIEEVVSWLKDTEASLQRMRSPLVSMVASERGIVLAIADGYRDPTITDSNLSRRKAERTTILLALNRVSDLLRNRVEELDRELSGLKEKMVSFVAAASVKVSLPLPPREPRNLWLDRVWQTLGRNEETATLFAYLNAALRKHDRLYLLDEILRDLVLNMEPASQNCA